MARLTRWTVALLLLCANEARAEDVSDDDPTVRVEWTAPHNAEPWRFAKRWHRTPKVVKGLTAVEGTSLAAGGFFFLGVGLANIDCADDVCFVSPAFAALGAGGLVLSAFSFATLTQAVREARRRLRGVPNARGSTRFNRWAIAYDTVMASTPLAAGIPLGVSARAEGESLGSGAWALVALTTTLASLHLWSLSMNARELRGRKRRRGGGPEFTGVGVRW